MHEENAPEGLPLDTTPPARPTAGPWTVEEGNWCGHNPCPHDHVELVIIGGTGLPIMKRDTYDFDVAVARADAHLIAAAPALLAACEQAEAFIAALRVPQDQADAALQVFVGGKVLDAIRAAIALARSPEDR